MMLKLSLTLTLSIVLASFGAPNGARAQVTPFSDPAAFQAALTESFTLLNLDDQPLVAFGVPYDLTSAGPAAALNTLGVVSVNPAAVVGGQAGQISEPGRDRLIINGAGSSAGGNLAIDLVDPVDGFGARSNLGDGGRVRAFSEPGLAGVFLGEADMSAGGFGGLISDMPIRSVEVTCDFDFDLICGVYDLQYGKVAAAAVPTGSQVGGIVILLIGLTGVGVLGMHRAPLT
jgi:hypothetical protein